MLTEATIVILITTSAGLLLKLSSLIFKSKCNRCKLGCLEVERDIEAEQEEMEFRTLHKQSSNLELSNNNQEDKI